jgi:hypothetical protein
MRSPFFFVAVYVSPLISLCAMRSVVVSKKSRRLALPRTSCDYDRIAGYLT